jgi:hypothetical protein
MVSCNRAAPDKQGAAPGNDDRPEVGNEEVALEEAFNLGGGCEGKRSLPCWNAPPIVQIPTATPVLIHRFSHYRNFDLRQISRLNGAPQEN